MSLFLDISDYREYNENTQPRKEDDAHNPKNQTEKVRIDENNLNRRRIMRELAAMNLPDIQENIGNADILYGDIVANLGLFRMSDIMTLRYMVAKRIDDMQVEVIQKAEEDFAAGKIKRKEDLPLYREERKDGQIVLRNVPPYMMKWFAFAAWLNEKVGAVPAGN